jgi:hypothetical protein
LGRVWKAEAGRELAAAAGVEVTSCPSALTRVEKGHRGIPEIERCPGSRQSEALWQA